MLRMQLVQLAVAIMIAVVVLEGAGVDAQQPAADEYETGMIGPQYVAWRMSSSDTDAAFFLFHGCNHDHTDWYSLPEDLAIADYLSSRGFASVALASSERSGSRCWRAEQDLDVSLASVRTWVREHAIASDTPLFAIGASSGGMFVSELAGKAPHLFSGIVIMIAPGEHNAFAQAGREFPATAFLFMERDYAWASEENANLAARLLASRGVPTKVFRSSPAPLTAAVFSERCNDIDPMQSRYMYITIMEAGLLSCERSDTHPSEHCLLTTDPRHGAVYQALKDSKFPEARASVSLELFPKTEELMNVLFGQHELTRDHVAEYTEWLLRTAAERKSVELTRQ